MKSIKAVVFAITLVLAPTTGIAQSPAAGSPVTSAIVQMPRMHVDELRAMGDFRGSLNDLNERQREAIFSLVENFVRFEPIFCVGGGNELVARLDAILEALREQTGMLRALCERDSGDVDTSPCPPEKQ